MGEPDLIRYKKHSGPLRVRIASLLVVAFVASVICNAIGCPFWGNVIVAALSVLAAECVFSGFRD